MALGTVRRYARMCEEFSESSVLQGAGAAAGHADAAAWPASCLVFEARSDDEANTFSETRWDGRPYYKHMQQAQQCSSAALKTFQLLRTLFEELFLLCSPAEGWRLGPLPLGDPPPRRSGGAVARSGLPDHSVVRCDAPFLAYFASRPVLFSRSWAPVSCSCASCVTSPFHPKVPPRCLRRSPGPLSGSFCAL